MAVFLGILELFACTIGFLLVYNFHWKRRNLPPGPAPLPLVGNWLTVSKMGLEDAFILWKKQNGNM